MKIYLIGMPGSGKSTIGRKVAQALLVPSVDLDKEIETRERKSVSRIFAENGEDYFRQVESKILLEWAASENSFVMSTGGGTPCFYNGIDIMNQTGLSIFLDVPVRVLLSRIEKKTDRPLLQASDATEIERKLMSLRASRLRCYQQAAITIENADVSKLMEAIHLKK